MRSGSDNFTQNYLEMLATEIKDTADKEGLQIAVAAQYIIAEKLGYDLDEVEFVDGAGDRGIDWWYASNTGLHIFQVKTHNLTANGQIDMSRLFDNKGVADLNRAKNYLLSDHMLKESHRLTKLNDALNRIVRNYKSQETDSPIQIYLKLVTLGDGLTDQALEELAAFENILTSPCEYQNMSIQFYIDYLNVHDIIKAAWREGNRIWVDITGKKRKHIRLTPLRQSDKKHYLSDAQSAIFYCRAVDLVNAYDDFGYQIFEPNVRANIKNSTVNDAIRKSAIYRRSMKDFRFLNNGITITCSSYKKPSGQRNAFEVTEPGIVNGLQTVTSLHSAYNVLSNEDKEHFTENCYVFVRLLRNDRVNRIEEVVLATNNQNPMQPRNLVSNSAEQVDYARVFSRLGWFYEAKQGAWDAFKKDHKRWRPKIETPPAFFKSKRLDNHDLAQEWFAFMGFAYRAANDKKSLFDKDNYELIFLKRSKHHAYEHYGSTKEAIEDSISSSPDPKLMLLAHLTRVFASKVVPTTQANKKEALERKNVFDRETISSAEEETIFSEDQEYLLNQALKAMSLVFVEFVGFSLFRVFGSDTHSKGEILLRNYSWKVLAENFDIKSVLWHVTSREFEPNDLLLVMWFIFREAVETIMNSVWQTAYRNAKTKPRFLLSHRRQIYQEVIKMDEVLKRRVPLRVYTEGFEEGEGYFGFVKRIASMPVHNQVM